MKMKCLEGHQQSTEGHVVQGGLLCGRVSGPGAAHRGSHLRHDFRSAAGFVAILMELHSIISGCLLQGGLLCGRV